MAQISFLETGLDDLDGLPTGARREVVEALERVENHPEESLESASGQSMYEVEVDDHVVIVDWNRNDDRIQVLSIVEQSQMV